MLRTILAASIVGLAVIGATTAALPQDVTFNYAGTDFAVSKTSPVAISGTVDIEFGTRLEKSEDGTPNVGAVDTYKTDLTILDSVRLQGTIARKPWLPTGFTGNTKQDGSLAYDLKAVLKNPKNPTQTVNIGSWIGALRLDGNGRYFLDQPVDDRSNLRIVAHPVGKIAGFTSNFTGQIQGRVPEQAGLRGMASRASKQITKTYTRHVNGKTIKHTVKGADPMGFEQVMLAQGPLAGYAASKVVGSVDYDGEQGIWYVDLRLGYSVDGVQVTDRFSGTIRWNDDPNRSSNGLGWYDVSVRVNEPPTTEQDAFLDDGSSSEDAFFAEDNAVPGFTGKINYVDTFETGTTTPVNSKVTYNVASNSVSKIQTANFAKILLLIQGPFNDE
jgi:hypothetical protein